MSSQRYLGTRRCEHYGFKPQRALHNRCYLAARRRIQNMLRRDMWPLQWVISAWLLRPSRRPKELLLPENQEDPPDVRGSS